MSMLIFLIFIMCIIICIVSFTIFTDAVKVRIIARRNVIHLSVLYIIITNRTNGTYALYFYSYAEIVIEELHIYEHAIKMVLNAKRNSLF